MSQENVEIVRQAVDALNAFMRGELSSEAAMELADPQAEWHWHGRREMPDQPQLLRGVEVIGYLEEFRGVLADLVTEPLELIEAQGDRVLAFLRQSGRGRESDVPIEFHFFQVWTVRDGKVRRVETFRHHADALEAAGLQK